MQFCVISCSRYETGVDRCRPITALRASAAGTVGMVRSLTEEKYDLCHVHGALNEVPVDSPYFCPKLFFGQIFSPWRSAGNFLDTLFCLWCFFPLFLGGSSLFLTHKQLQGAVCFLFFLLADPLRLCLVFVFHARRCYSRGQT